MTEDFDAQGTTLELFVPGRLCLFGEHSDWAAEHRRTNPELTQGYTLIAPTNQGLYARVGTHPDALVIRSTMPDGVVSTSQEIPMHPKALLAEAEAGGFFSYAAGVAYRIQAEYVIRTENILGGLFIDNYRTDLPVKKGLSSSAAICVLTARALNQRYDLGMTARDEMEYAYLGEITTPSRCGRMDQACAYGSRPILMKHDTGTMNVEKVDVGGPIFMVIVDLGGAKDTTEILAALNRCYPFPQDSTARDLQHYLGPMNQEIVGRAVGHLADGDAQGLGKLMTETQRLFEEYVAPACPDELTAPLLHRVLGLESIAPFIWGGKGVGSQGDGSAQFVAKSEVDRDELMRVLGEEVGLQSKPDGADGGLSSLALDLQPVRGS